MFDAYARYYDAFYQGKDYAAEAAFVLSRLAAFGCKPGSLLDLGCGTGRHCREFAAAGAEVVGVDISERMIAEAEARRAGEPMIRFQLGDVRVVRLKRCFDAAVSLFHVMSYQTSNQDLAQAFACVAAHLEPGGLFLFDFWHGAGVLSDPPARRVRSLHHKGAAIERIATPDVDASANVVSVRYAITVADEENGASESFEELHRMRYLFWPEIQLLAEAAGFEPLECHPWMQDRDLAQTDWYAYALLRRRP